MLYRLKKKRRNLQPTFLEPFDLKESDLIKEAVEDILLQK